METLHETFLREVYGTIHLFCQWGTLLGTSHTFLWLGVGMTEMSEERIENEKHLWPHCTANIFWEICSTYWRLWGSVTRDRSLLNMPQFCQIIYCCHHRIRYSPLAMSAKKRHKLRMACIVARSELDSASDVATSFTGSCSHTNNHCKWGRSVSKLLSSSGQPDRGSCTTKPYYIL